VQKFQDQLVLNPFDEDAANTHEVDVRRVVPLPHRYIPLMLNRILTPAQA